MASPHPPAFRRWQAWSSRQCLGAIALGVGLGPGSGAIAVLVALIGAAVVARLSIAQIGGQTGDVLGAVEQVSEILILLVATRI